MLLEANGLDQAVDLAMITDAEVDELAAGCEQSKGWLVQMRNLAQPLVKGWVTGVVGLRGVGTPGRTLPASGRDGLGDGVLASGRSLPAWSGDGPATPTTEAMGPSPSAVRASRLLTGFTRAVVRGKNSKKCTSVPPLPSPRRPWVERTPVGWSGQNLKYMGYCSPTTPSAPGSRS